MVDLLVCQVGELGQAKAPSDRVHTSVSEKCNSLVVRLRSGGVIFDGLAIKCREVFAFVQVLEDARASRQIVVG